MNLKRIFKKPSLPLLSPFSSSRPNSLPLSFSFSRKNSEAVGLFPPARYRPTLAQLAPRRPNPRRLFFFF
jgi:hypothetical protein